MPSIQDYVIAAQRYDYDTINQIVDDTEFLARELSQEDIAYYAYIILSASKFEMFKQVLDIFETINILDDLHIMNQIAIDPRTKEQIFLKLKLYYPEITPVELISEWTDQVFTEYVPVAIQKIINAYGIPDYSILKTLLDELDQQQKYDLYNYIFGLASQVSDYAEIPAWIDTKHIVTQNELDAKLQELKAIKVEVRPDQLPEQLYNLIAPYSETTLNQITKDLAQTNFQDLQTITQLINHIDSEFKEVNDKALIPYFGPSHPAQYPIDGDIKGQDRMLLCNFFDIDSWTDEPFDFFTGTCDQCGLQIRHRHHCVRMPIINGMWEGSFCSWKCCREYTDERYFDDAPVIKDFIDLYEKELETYKIYDRNIIENLPELEE